MNRVFLSLYAVIVVCVILMGWGLDKLWQHFSPPPTATSAQRDLLALIERNINQPQHFKPLASQIMLLNFDDFAQSALSAELARGQPVLLHNQQGQQEIYQRTQRGDKVIRLTLPAPSHKQGELLYPIFLTLFYGAIGLVIFIWVWPLMRDVRRLEQQTKHVGQHALPKPLTVMPGSAVKHLACAFNAMAERIKDLLASHKEMTYAVSHELRTPLARMKFALAMLQDASCANDAQANNQIQSLSQDIDEMDALITQLLSYAGYEQSSGPLIQQQGDMAFLMSELIQRAKASHAFKLNPHAAPLEILLECKNNQTQACCEWQLMERAVFNVIHNALRFAKQRVLVTLDSSLPNHYRITVEDDGPGIAPAERARVFESFVRLEATPNAQVRGFGLGLAIVQRVLKWHQGSAKVEASKMGGALFILEWPKT